MDYDTDCGKHDAEKFVRSLGWKIKREFFTKHSIGFMLAYTFNGIEDAVKAEVSFGVKGSHEKRKAESDFLPVSKRVEMYTFWELNKQKEEAMLDRKEWKDLYDLYWMREVGPKEFKIRDMKAFGETLGKLQVPKTANAYIPSAKRPNWDETREKMKKFVADG